MFNRLLFSGSVLFIFINCVLIVRLFLIYCFRAVLLAGVLLPGRAAYSQQLQPAPWNDPAVVWLMPAQAQVAVKGKLDQLEPQLADLIPGTGQHTDTLRQIVFYKSILRSLVAGLSVQESIGDAVLEAASVGGLHEHTFTPEAILRDLYDEALALLSS